MRHISFLIATLACAACGTQNPTGPEPSDLQDAWSWLMSEGGLLPQRHTPESTGYDQTIVFGADSVFEWFRNDSLLARAKYFVGHDSSLSSREVVYFMDIIASSVSVSIGPMLLLCGLTDEPCAVSSIEFVSRDTLILHDLCFDCFNHWYLRTSQN
jgi:hypothetical protein